MITINYSIDKEDQLTAQLFLVSKSERIKKKRRKNRLLSPIIFIILSIISLITKDYFLPIYFLLFSIAYYFIYPIWERRHYIKHYQGFIEDKFQDNQHIQAELIIDNEHFKIKDDYTESKVKTSLIKEFHEIQQCIFIILDEGQTLFLPKNKLENVEEIRTQLQDLANHLKINYTIEEDWKWK